MSPDGRPRHGRNVRVRVVVHGLVQGVWFRESCRRTAIGLDVAGWVRNRSDGTVEAEFVGPEPAVAQAVAWCRQGPPRAEVSGIDVTELERWQPDDATAATEASEPACHGFRVR